MAKTVFDAAAFFATPERQAQYISAALETGDVGFVRDAVGIVARARGMAEIAKAAGLNRESLYRALGETGNPELATMLRVLAALGLELRVHPIPKRPVRRKMRQASQKICRANHRTVLFT
jgi:probable addiction module antidote protein